MHTANSTVAVVPMPRSQGKCNHMLKRERWSYRTEGKNKIINVDVCLGLNSTAPVTGPVCVSLELMGHLPLI